MNQSARNNLSHMSDKFEAIVGVHSDGIACTALPHKHTNPKHGKVEVEFTLLDKWTILKKNICGASTNDKFHMLNNYNDVSNTNPSIQLYSPDCIGLTKQYSAMSTHHMVGVRNANNMSFKVDDQHSERTTTGNMTLGRLGIFTQNDAGSTDGFKPIDNRVPTGVAITSFKYWDGNELIADLIPCIEKETNEICFFNKVDDTFVKNLIAGGKFLAYNGEQK